ncbi:MAG: shikimate dehydrogenase family protein [Candidatus Fimadaptatus sp.]
MKKLSMAGMMRFGALDVVGRGDWTPAIHNALFAARGNEAMMLMLHARPGQEREALAIMGTAIAGMSVAAPFAVRMRKLLDEVDGDAAQLRMVDTVACLPTGGLAGALLLPGAIERAMRGACVRGSRALVLGAGVKATCAAHALMGMGAQVTIAAPAGPLSADRLAARLGGGARSIAWQRAGAQRCDVLINATGLGGRGYAPLDIEPCAEAQLVLDMVIDPVDTQLIAAAAASGARTLAGFDIEARVAECAQDMWGFAPLRPAVRMDAIGQVRECARECG